MVLDPPSAVLPRAEQCFPSLPSPRSRGEKSQEQLQGVAETHQMFNLATALPLPRQARIETAFRQSAQVAKWSQPFDSCTHARSTSPRGEENLSGSKLTAEPHYLATEGRKLKGGRDISQGAKGYPPPQLHWGIPVLPPGPAPRGFPRLRAAATSGRGGPELHV